MKLKTSRKIFAHIDCDSFFASCEILRNPTYKEKYVCVGSEIVIAASYNAKAVGVKCGTPIWEARHLLRRKDAVYCGVDIPYYQTVSRKLMVYLREHTLDVRKFSIDEAFVEITGLPELQNMSLEEYVKDLQQKILAHTGVPVSIGVSNTRLRAKMFSKIHKPFGFYIGLDSDENRALFAQMSFREIPFIGSQTAKKLDFYITTIEDYLGLGYYEVVRRFGKNGGKIWLELSGVESMGFEEKHLAKSIGRSRGFNREQTSNARILWKRILENLERLEQELYEAGTELRHLQLLLIDADWKKYSCEYEFADYLCQHKVFVSALREMFSQIYISGKVYRKTGVFSCDIRSREDRQMSIFGHLNTQHEQQEKLEKVMKDLSKKYGEDILKYGV